ncbi:TRAP transporter large permease [Rhodobacteraceae bacterium RKSG542]|uniref:TRAP transporter large permease n=1 Tax=Pseudovibrio flavus TaxID=2529854 RepID=UPI0012BC23D1|nr:TRAP transporter large permease [Pseudovibrio flavus]MTI16473.1 TRAP transporter large permease [Pseudovibrio flavus]
MHPVVLLIGSLLLLIALRVPIAFALGIASFITISELGLSYMTVANQMFTSINSFALLAVPFFLFLGRLMNDGGITDRLLKVADVTVGTFKGGLGHVNVGFSMMFASISGSAAADTASVGAIIIPAMKKDGYPAPFAVALTAVSSTIGMIIPPSIIMVLYGAFGNVSVGALFLGGVVPGLLVGFGQMGYTYYIACKYGMQPSPRKPMKEIAASIWYASPALSLPVIILGGIMGGICTATEAAAIAVVVGFILAVGVYKNVKVSEIPALLSDSVISYTLPLFCVATAGIMGFLIAYLNIAQDVADFILGITTDPYMIYALIVGFLLIVGTVLSPVTAVVIFLPILQHLGQVAGYDQVHLGLVVVLALTIGLVTPPYGISLLIASQIGGVSSVKAFLAVIPLICISLAVIALGIIFPDVFLILPKTFMPEAFGIIS